MRDRTDDRPLEATYTHCAFFASVMAPVIAAIGFLGRLGFPDNSLLKWGEFVGLSWFLIHFSYAARKLFRTPNDPLTGVWWQGHAPLTLAGLALVAVCGVGDSRVAGATAMVFAIIGAAALVLRLVEYARSLLSHRVVWLCLFALLMGLYAAGSVWGEGFENPLFVENLCNGYAHIDTLYHATLANMLRTYGVSSTGLDGLPFVAYHFGSHWIFARISNLLDLPVIDFYNLAYPVIFAPFMTFSLLTFAVSVAEIWRGSGRIPEPSSGEAARSSRMGRPGVPHLLNAPFNGGHRMPGLLFWFVAAAGVIGLLPRGVPMEPLARAAIFASESYGMAISVALLGIAAVSALSRDIATAPHMRSIDVLLGFVFLCAVPSVVGLFKISVIMLLVVAAVWFFVRLRLYRYKIMAAAFLYALIFLYWDWLFIYQPEYGQIAGMAPFSALKALVGFTWWSYYWLFCYAWTLLFVVLRLREEGARTLGEVWAAFRERRLLDVEFVLIIAVLGSAPEILLGNYSSTHYFADDQHWLALGLTLAVVLRPVSSGSRNLVAAAADRMTAGAQFQAAGAEQNTGWLDRIAMHHVWASLLGLFVVGTFVLNTSVLLSGVAGILKASLALSPSATSPLDAAWDGNLSEARQILDRQVAAVDQRMRTDKQIIPVLRGLDRLPLEEKRRTLLYIPKTNLQFWDLLHTAYSPKVGPFVAPALSGIAMLDGLYWPSKDDPWSAYGYYAYDYPYLTPPYEKRPQPPLDEYLPILKKRCVAKGMNQLIVIEERNGRVEAHKFDCP
jgi:hypothetical protein